MTDDLHRAISPDCERRVFFGFSRLCIAPDVRIPSTLLGNSVAFNRHHELIGSRYWMYQIEGGTYRLIS